MGNKQEGGFSWEDNYRIIQKNLNDGTLIINKEGTDQQFIGRQILCSDKQQSKQIKKLINLKANNPSPFLTKLAKCHYQQDQAYCSSDDKIHVLFEKPGQTLRQEILARKFSNQKISEQEGDIILQAGVKGLRSLREMGHSHNNIATSSFFIDDKRKVVLGDPWITPPTYTSQMNHNLCAYPSPQKILFQNDQIMNFCPYRSDLFSLGMVVLEALNFQHMDVLYEKGFRKLLDEKVQQKLNNIQSEDLRRKLSILLSFDPQYRDQIYKFYRKPGIISGSQVKSRVAHKIVQEATPIAKVHQSNVNQNYTPIKPTSEDKNKSFYKFLPHQQKNFTQTQIYNQPHNFTSNLQTQPSYSNSIMHSQNIQNTQNLSQRPITEKRSHFEQTSINKYQNFTQNGTTNTNYANFTPYNGHNLTGTYSSPQYNSTTYGTQGYNFTHNSGISKQVKPSSFSKYQPSKINFSSTNYSNFPKTSQNFSTNLMGTTNYKSNYENLNSNLPGAITTSIYQHNPKFTNFSHNMTSDIKKDYSTNKISQNQIYQRKSQKQISRNFSNDIKDHSLTQQKNPQTYIKYGTQINNGVNSTSNKNIKLNQPIPSDPNIQQNSRSSLSKTDQNDSKINQYQVNSSMQQNFKQEGDEYIKIYQNSNQEGRKSSQGNLRSLNRSKQKLILQQGQYPISDNQYQQRYTSQSYESREESTDKKQSISQSSERKVIDTILQQSEQGRPPKKSDQTPDRRPTKQYNSTIKQVSESEVSNSRGDEQELVAGDDYIEQQYEAGIYKGQKKNGMRNGFGKLLYRQGSMYEGQWKDNMMHGKGKLYYASGNVAYDGQWNMDEFHGDGKVFNEEELKLDGPFNYKNMADMNDYWISYEGKLDSDRRHGKGKLKFSNGEIFVGNFDNDTAEGEGKFYTLTGDIVHGVWSNNILTNVL